MKIAVEGCAHGELDKIYEVIKNLEQKENFKIDLLICCGDFQASRNREDLQCMAVPQKYCKMCSFYKYYNGEKEAPVLTIFVGGNHEASNYMQELPYGGWVAPKIYYLGYANVINIAGIRIAGISGIYKSNDYGRGHFEIPPYNDSTKRSVYHIRNLEVFRLKQIAEPIDIFLSHDWPSGVCNFGNKELLLKFKPYFLEDIQSGKLGSKPCEELLNELQPNYWFAAHLHWKFAALVPHANKKVTKFLALDKCLPSRRFLQVVDIPHDSNLEIEINYDLEWLTVLFLTNHLLSVKNCINFMPGSNSIERWSFKPSEEEKSLVLSKMNNNLVVPKNFERTANAFKSEDSNVKIRDLIVEPQLNPQTILFCKKLCIDDPMYILMNKDGQLDSNLDDILENSCNNTTFINDSDFEIASSPVKNRTSLILPKPINDTESVEASEVDAIFNQEEVESSLSQQSEDGDGDDSIGKVETAKVGILLQSNKKFKRRNINICEPE